LVKTARVELQKGDDTIVARFTPLAEQFFSELGIASLPTFKEVKSAVVEPVKKDPPVEVKVKSAEIIPPPPPPPAIDMGLGQRTAGKVLVLGGAAVAVVGGVLLGVGQGIGGSLGVQNGNLPAGKVADLRTAQTLTGTGIPVAAVGVVAAGVGAVVWAIAPEAPVKVSAVVMPGGAMVGIQGEF
jgi:hypothetical protein